MLALEADNDVAAVARHRDPSRRPQSAPLPDRKSGKLEAARS